MNGIFQTRSSEQGLRQVLEEPGRKARRLPPLVTVRGKGLVSEFKQGGWDRIRDEIYRERGAWSLGESMMPVWPHFACTMA